jgi:hypothetical protein
MSRKSFDILKNHVLIASTYFEHLNSNIWLIRCRSVTLFSLASLLWSPGPEQSLHSTCRKDVSIYRQRLSLRSPYQTWACQQRYWRKTGSLYSLWNIRRECAACEPQMASSAALDFEYRSHDRGWWMSAGEAVQEILHSSPELLDLTNGEDVRIDP